VYCAKNIARGRGFAVEEAGVDKEERLEDWIKNTVEEEMVCIHWCMLVEPPRVAPNQGKINSRIS
jgi:hypothetical protein